MAGGELDLWHMWEQMGLVARIVAFILVFMSMWSFGVAIERYYTFSQARKQSKLYAPQVAKHLKDGRLKDGMLPKAKAIKDALAKGVRSVHLVSGMLPDALLIETFTNEGSGTMVESTPLAAAGSKAQAG